MDDMHETLVISPPTGGFDLERIHRYLATVPYAVRDVGLPHVYVIAKSYQQLESAIEMSANEGRFPYSTSLIYIWPERIEITFDDETAAFARSLASWLELEPQATPRIGEMDEGFPVGATLCDGAFVITRQLHGPPNRGMYAGRDRVTAAEVLVTLGRAQTLSPDELADKLAMRVDGITPLRYIGRVESAGEARYDAMVEQRPAGEPASTCLRLPLDVAVAASLIHQVADIVIELSSEQQTSLRPELIFVENDRVTAIAPRCELFHALMPRAASQGEIVPFPYLYQTFEPSEDEGVFALSAILAHWVTGEHPFEGEGPTQQIMSLYANRRRALTLPAAVADAIEAGLSADPAQRPELILWMNDVRAACE